MTNLLLNISITGFGLMFRKTSFLTDLNGFVFILSISVVSCPLLTFIQVMLQLTFYDTHILN